MFHLDIYFLESFELHRGMVSGKSAFSPKTPKTYKENFQVILVAPSTGYVEVIICSGLTYSNMGQWLF